MTTRRVIAQQVRDTCTIPSNVLKKSADEIVRAVADWIEDPPDWVTKNDDTEALYSRAEVMDALAKVGVNADSSLSQSVYTVIKLMGYKK